MTTRAEGKRVIQIHGAGPAAAAAAMSARRDGVGVQIFARSLRPRHKVCGEFISAEACRVLQELGVWDEFMGLNPARTVRCRLWFGSRRKEWKLSEPAFGLSRLALDRLLLDRAVDAGAEASSSDQSRCETGASNAAIIAATGRRGIASKPSRLFAFKSHFSGPADDSVELFFDGSGYVGVSSIEDGGTNVCGIANETSLQRYGFQFDEFVHHNAQLAERLKPLARRMPWLSTGPLVFSSIGAGKTSAGVYPAGDALGFVDPFTGSGILNALLTGRLAGQSAARGVTPEQYVRECRKLLHRPFAFSAMVRNLLDSPVLPYLATLVPGDWIYRITRAG